MQANRIYFKDNPWPEGHPIVAFSWLAKQIDGKVWFDFHLESADYDSEREIDTEEIDYDSDWEAPGAWKNYHACTISSTYWENPGFPVCALADYTPSYLNGRCFNIDLRPELLENWDEFAFHIYLLGHDAVAQHQIHFEQVTGTTLFNIQWTGKIALAYAGQDKFMHDFSIYIENVPFPKLEAD